jgi:uncharacterized MAPEG superfamily protein
MDEWVLDGLRRIEVDLQGLRAFAERLSADADESLQPMGAGILRDHASGVPFGAGLQASEMVRVSQQRYQLCLTAGGEALSSFLYSVEVLLAGARAVAERYAESDALAAASVTDVQALLRQAQVGVDGVVPAAGGPAKVR